MRDPLAQPLREELALLAGPVLPDGQPSWTLHDPVRNQFFRIDWPSFEILQRWGQGSAAAIAADIARCTTLKLEAEDVQAFAAFLSAHQLVRPADSAQQLATRLAKQRGTLWQWLLHNYLFVRIPLVRPDAWLSRWKGVVAPLFTTAFALATVIAAALGLVQVARQWETFVGHVVDTFSVSGALAVAVAIVVVKTLHELGHAFTAKRLGCRVPTMGIAFVVLWPMAYTDTNETWRLTDARQRLQVASAGIATEMGVAAWCTLAWGLLPDGPLRSAAFVLASTSWVATLVINASPFMRFDGYFILSDALDMPNLHERCFALARWRLREGLFDLGEPVPEVLPQPVQRRMIAFAWITWIYRLVLFLGIALLVYHLFFKLLGIVLFAVEIAWFILRPLQHELKAWGDRRAVILQRGRSAVSALVLLGLASLAFVPWPGRVSASALLHPVQVWPVHAPGGARLEALNFREGDTVEAGAVMARLHVADLQTRRQAVTSRVEQLREQAAAAGFSEQTRPKMRVAEDSLATARAELSSIDTELRDYQPSAPWRGTLRDVDPDLHPGQWLARKERLGVLVREGSPWTVEAWLEESAVARVAVGQRARFYAQGGDSPPLDLTVQAVDRDATRVLPRRELSAQAGGDVLVRDKAGQPIPERAVYRVTLAPQPGADLSSWTRHHWRGTVTIHAQSEAPAWRYLRQAGAVVVREFGF